MSQDVYIFLRRLQVQNSPIHLPNFQEVVLPDEKPAPTNLLSINGAKKKSRDFHFGKFLQIVATVISQNALRVRSSLV